MPLFNFKKKKAVKEPGWTVADIPEDTKKFNFLLVGTELTGKSSFIANFENKVDVNDSLCADCKQCRQSILSGKVETLPKAFLDKKHHKMEYFEHSIPCQNCGRFFSRENWTKHRCTEKEKFNAKKHREHSENTWANKSYLRGDEHPQCNLVEINLWEDPDVKEGIFSWWDEQGGKEIPPKGCRYDADPSGLDGLSGTKSVLFVALFYRRDIPDNLKESVEAFKANKVVATLAASKANSKLTPVVFLIGVGECTAVQKMTVDAAMKETGALKVFNVNNMATNSAVKTLDSIMDEYLKDDTKVKKRGLEDSTEGQDTEAFATFTKDGTSASVLLEANGSVDEELLQRMFGVGSPFLQDAETGVYLSNKGVEAGGTYVVHAAPLYKEATGPCPAKTVVSVKKTDVAKSAAVSLSPMPMTPMSSLTTSAQVAFNGFMDDGSELAQFLAENWKDSSDMIKRLGRPVDVLSRAGLKTFEDLKRLDSNAFEALALPIALKKLLAQEMGSRP